jgi:hypothetical protein
MNRSLLGSKATMLIARLNRRRWSVCLPIAFITLVVVSLCRSFGAPSASLSSPQRWLRIGGGGVRGSLYVQVGAKSSENAKAFQEQIFLPDIKVYLRNTATGRDSASVVTDLFGRYAFPPQPPGKYQLRWDAQLGWAAGQHTNLIVIGNTSKYPIPARVVPEKGRGMIYGRVTFADSGAPWFYDELFADKHTASVTVLDIARRATLAGPIHTNVTGWYAAAGLPRGANVTVRAQTEAVTVTRIFSAASVSFGGAVARTNLRLPNHKPEVLTVVPESGGEVVQTAPGGTTIQLNALTRDLDRDRLTYDWRVLPGMGSLTAASGSSINWTLPTAAGKYSVYLRVKDDRGGYARHRVDFEVGRENTVFSGRVVDLRTGAPVVGATVSVNSTAAPIRVGRVPVNSTTTTTTAGNGFFRVQASLDKRYVVNITKTGYALFSRVVDAGETGQTWKLVPAQQQVVDPTKPIVLVDRRPEIERKQRKGVTVRVPAGALVDASGNKPLGPLTAYLVTYDITNGEAPGDWGARKDGRDLNLISYGAGFAEFVDAAGTRYNNLVPGETAEVEFAAPRTMLAGAPAGAPMWSYDESDGYWKESGTGVFRAATGTYVGKVRHFSAFNTDLALDNAACLKVLLYPPLPTGVRLRMTDPTGTNFTQTFEFVLDRPLRGIYRVPANINVRLQLFSPEGNEYSNLKLEEVAGTPLPGTIVNSGPPIPAGQTLWPDEPYETCKLVILRLDIEANPSVFLTFKEEGTEAQAQGYYTDVDPPEPTAPAGSGRQDGRRNTLGEWWATNGFTLGSDGWPLDSTNGDPSVVRTSYLNDNDLGSGRDMYFRDLRGGHLAAFVTNYGLFDQNADNANKAAARGSAPGAPPTDQPGATVCMEYAPVEGQGSTPIVKFFVFAGNGGKANAQRQTGADLDTFGVKYVPNLCTNCHGGDSYRPADPANPSFADIDMGARFRELDYATYKFPTGRIAPDAVEKDRFKQQNLFIKNAGSGCASDAIRELITGWYQSGGVDQDNTWYPGKGSSPSDPPKWNGLPQQQLYLNVVAKSCRTCHVAFDDDPGPSGINFTTYDQFKARHDFVKNIVLCDAAASGTRFMPHAVVTYRNFWLSGSPHRPGVLRNYSDGSNWTPLGECP